MPNPMHCVRGHRWEDESTDPFAAPAPCPVCGESASRPTDTRRSLTADEPTLVTLPPPHQPPPQPLDEGTKPGADLPRVPGYEILGVLGRGGMGAVYRARQIKADRIVALKLPYAAAGPELRSRFRSEAKAIARLQHPHIVQVFEVGETDQTPYMALEFCAGGSLADRLDGTPMPSRTAAELIATVGRAVAAAHAAGIVHRDLKPANILLGSVGDTTATCVPKVADFGLARSLSESAGRTLSGAVIGTPSYMAPEQAGGGGKRVGPPADIHALGAVLYELLTGRPPFKGTTVFETLELLGTQEPVPPSRFQPRLPRDLETIVLKCLRKAPDQRYPSAGALVDDLNRLLAGQPVLARPVGWPERLAKRVRRNPLASLLLLLLSVAVGSGFGFGIWKQVRLTAERDRARAHYQMSMRAVESLLTDVAESDLAAEPLAEKTRQALLEKALVYYVDILDLEAGDSTVEWEAARAARRVGDIYRLLGRYPEAVSAYNQAAVRLDRLRANGRDDPDLWREVALVHNWQGEAFRLNDQFDEADAAYQAAAVIQTRLRAADPDHAGYALDLAQSLYNRGIVAGDHGRFGDAENRFREATAAIPADTTRPEHRQHSARIAINLSDVLRKSGRPADAVAAAQSAVAGLDALIAAAPTRLDLKHERASAGLNLANALSAVGDKDGALSVALADRQRLTELVRNFPATVLLRVDLARICATLGTLESSRMKPAAEAHTREAVGHWESLLAARPGVPSYHGGLGIALGNLGWFTKDRPDESRRHLLRGTLEVLVALRANPDDPVFRHSLRQQTRNLADNLVLAGDDAEIVRQSERIRDGLPGHPYGMLRAVCFLARATTTLKNGQAPPAEKTRRTDTYCRQAIALVLTCDAATRRAIESDPESAALRQQPEFQTALGPPNR